MVDVMNERRKHREGCAADESIYDHSDGRRNHQSRAFKVNTAFTLLPQRPVSCVDSKLSSRHSEMLSLQVQGFCCPLLQRPSSGRSTQNVRPPSRGGDDGSLRLLSRDEGDGPPTVSNTYNPVNITTVQGFCCPLQQRPSSARLSQRGIPPSRGGADGSLRMLASLRGRLESRATLGFRSRTGSRPGTTPKSGAPTMSNNSGAVCERAETPTNPCEGPARHGPPGAATVSELHLYLPSSVCEDEEPDTYMEEMRTSAETMNPEESEVKPSNSDPPVFPKPSHSSRDQTRTGPPTP